MGKTRKNITFYLIYMKKEKMKNMQKKWPENWDSTPLKSKIEIKNK